MACVQYPKLLSYTLQSREDSHIFRDPPRSIHTRKKERVGPADSAHLIREDNSRINEGVRNYAAGVNPLVEIDFQNRTQTTTTIPYMQASNPYKVNKSFRPPLFRQEDLLPLSRQKHPYTTVTSNPGVRELSGFVDCGLALKIDQQPIIAATSVRKASGVAVPPSAVYRLEQYPDFDQQPAMQATAIKKLNGGMIPPTAVYKIESFQETALTHAINQELIRTSVTSAVGSQYEDTDREVDFYGVGSSVRAHPNNISTSTSVYQPVSLVRDDGTVARTKDYAHSVVTAVPGRDVATTEDGTTPLQRNLPVYRAQSAVGDLLHGYDPLKSEYELKQKVMTAAYSKPNNTRTQLAEERLYHSLTGRDNYGEYDPELRSLASVPVIDRDNPIPRVARNRLTETRRNYSNQLADRWSVNGANQYERLAVGTGLERREPERSEPERSEEPVTMLAV